MAIPFPERYHKAARYVDLKFGDLEHNAQLSNEHKLVFYALRQQVEVGPCQAPAPALWHVKERHMYNAWRSLASKSKFECMVLYVEALEQYLGRTDWVEELARMETESTVTPPGPSTDGMEDDIQKHQAPTEENIRYLSHQLAITRRELERYKQERDERAPQRLVLHLPGRHTAGEEWCVPMKRPHHAEYIVVPSKGVRDWAKWFDML
ncbi:Acyl CoA binding protein, putative [Angomonas deanei]|uniref:Acyl CoA binding protein, putative n=1 Tax=Angomonas deanei TaxID=59799 RepID=A0A7G2C205_9TRYP|nr:Acyl CoA binding protein, putative [Angomonas deanei]